MSLESGTRRTPFFVFGGIRDKHDAPGTDANVDDTPDPHGVIAALWRAAKAGDTSAARELRAWLDREKSAAGGEGEDWASLPSEDRERERRELREEIERRRRAPPEA